MYPNSARELKRWEQARIYTVNPFQAINLSNRRLVFNVFLEAGEMALAVVGYQKKPFVQSGQVVACFK
jgi:hypothetical protein